MDTFVREYHLLIRNASVIIGLIAVFVIISGFIRFAIGIKKRNCTSSK